jgi:hypothetical protein
MSTYTLEDLRSDGPPIAMAMLLACLKRGEPFVTYSQIRAALENKLGVDTIFPTQIGHVAGALMDMILARDPDAPLINVLITRANGIPGKGASGYLATRYRQPSLCKWNKISNSRKLQIVERERQLIQRYGRWNEISQTLFGTNAPWPAPPSDEADYPRHGRGGEAESAEHKALKAWVAADPTRIGLSKTFGPGDPEARLLSGDEVDVMFSKEMVFRAVEVKSIRSGYEDLKRGIYQCVKYREVKVAELQPYSADVEAILVTEQELPPDLLERAQILGVRCKCVAVNKQSK